MNDSLEWLGNSAAVVGILICLLTGVVRVTGSYYFLGFEALTLFIGGTALMVFACLVKLHQLARR